VLWCGAHVAGAVVIACTCAMVTSADVQQVLVRGGKAAGVQLANGKEISSDVVSCKFGLLGFHCTMQALPVVVWPACISCACCCVCGGSGDVSKWAAGCQQAG
jgi:hypothetical protein